jgi:hypothetical protein
MVVQRDGDGDVLELLPTAATMVLSQEKEPNGVRRGREEGTCERLR